MTKIITFLPHSSNHIAGGGVTSSVLNLNQFLYSSEHNVEYVSLNKKLIYNPQLFTQDIGSKNLATNESQSAALLDYVVRKDPDIAIFPDICGYAYELVRARSLGVLRTKIIIVGHGCSEWNISQNIESTQTEFIKQLIFIEKFCIENCDHFVSVSNAYSKWLKDNDYKFCGSVLPNFSGPVESLKPVSSNNREIVFAGRVEFRKGLDLLLESLDSEINANFTFTFFIIGERTDQTKLESTLELAGVVGAKIFLNHDSHFIRSYLNDPSKLLIIPSAQETSSMLYLENCFSACSILLSDIPVFRELLSDDSNIFFERTPAELNKKIKQILSNGTFISSPRLSNSEILSGWREIISSLAKVSDGVVSKSEVLAPFEVCIIHHSHSSYLPRLISTLKCQTVRAVKITILDNCPKSRTTELLSPSELEDINVLYSEDILSPGQARNFLVSNTNTNDFIFLDDDNIVSNRFIEHFYKIWENNKSAIITVNKSVMDKDEYIYSVVAYRGETNTVSLGTNNLGDSTFLCSRENFAKIGGFSDLLVYEDWEFLIKAHKLKVKIICNPFPDLGYRVHLENLTLKIKHLDHYKSFLDNLSIDKDKQKTLIRSFLGNHDHIPSGVSNIERIIKENINQKYRTVSNSKTIIKPIDGILEINNVLSPSSGKLYLSLLSFTEGELYMNSNNKFTLKKGLNNIILTCLGDVELLKIFISVELFYIKTLHFRVSELPIEKS